MIGSRIATEMLERLQKPPFTNQLNHSDQVLRLMLKAQDPGESPDETAAEYEWAIRKNPADRVLHYNYGLFLFEHNRDAAASSSCACPGRGMGFRSLPRTGCRWNRTHRRFTITVSKW